MFTIQETNALRDTIAHSEANLRTNKQKLDNIERQCQHTFTEPTRHYVETTEWRNGNMVKQGIDFWYEQVPYKVTVPEWQRICTKCGKLEKTQKQIDKPVKVPAF